VIIVAHDMPISGAGARSFEDRYREVLPRGTRLAALIMNSEYLAEDIAHEAFIRVASRLSTNPGATAFGAYYRRAVVNGALSALRSERRRTSRESSFARPDTPTEDERSSDFFAVVSSLSARQRAAIVLRYWDDLDDQEIARVLRCRPATVRSLIARSLQVLRTELR